MFRLVLIFSFFSATVSWAQDYRVSRPPNIITENRIEYISIVTRAEMELGKLPKHPKITWLGYSSIRLPNDAYGNMQTDNRISFIATSPGLIDFPPVPIVLENKEFFIRIGEIKVTGNTTSKTDTRLEVLWNGSAEIPKQVHLGEAVEVQFIELVENKNNRFRGSSYFSQPSNRVEGAQWHQYLRYSGRKPVPSDYFYTYSQGGFFSRYGSPENYSEMAQEIDGVDYNLRAYKARLYFTKIGKSTGHLSATLGTSRIRSRHRTHVIPFEIEVLPIPPIPNNQAIDSGLVGDWEFQIDYRPLQPAASRPFIIDISITGQGNPNLRNEFDFSSEGFPSVESDLYPKVGSNYDFWEADFTQTLLPTGKVGTLPAISLASFDTVDDKWRFHKITPTLNLPGTSDITALMTPRNDAGNITTRPVLLNLPVATFGVFALAPLLPFLFGLAKRRLDSRDPEQKKRERTLKRLIISFKSGKGTAEEIDNELLPILRHKLHLPSGSTVREIASALDDRELAKILEVHAEVSFSGQEKPFDFIALGRELTKISLLLLITMTSLKGSTLDEANQAFNEANFTKAISIYDHLIEESPNRASLHYNLAQAHLSANDPSRARASCHTALLLNPLDQEARALMSDIRERQGDLTVSRNRFFDLRPDQWVVVASVIWVIAYLFFGIRKFVSLPRWPGFALGAVAIFFLGTAAWRQSQHYSSDQFMVLADELPREPKAGTPDWNYPALRAGQIIQISEVNETHALVQSSESSFWLPINELQQVW
ncbi:MAG: tetratricopeptide repeat protein [Akkermansiaceae bacterium]|nr:tetratricopeptide repeat protein [Akkermansiaceae bacterium]